jgi:hypothetical protein
LYLICKNTLLILTVFIYYTVFLYRTKNSLKKGMV